MSNESLDADSHVARNLESYGPTGVANEAWYHEWQSEKIALIEHLIDAMPLRGSLADVGCFTGVATARYRALGFRRVVGFDASDAALARARQRGIEAISWVAGKDRCPVGAAEFEVVVAADVIEHLVDTDAFVTELERVLAPHGRAIVTTPNLAFWLSRLRLLTGRTPWAYPGASSTVRADLTVDLNHIRVTTRLEWEALFRAHRFEVLGVHGWSILPAIHGGAGIRFRRFIDRFATVRPDLAFGLLFVLAKSAPR